MNFIDKGNQRWALFDKKCIQRLLNESENGTKLFRNGYLTQNIFACLAFKFTFKSSIIFSTLRIIFSVHIFERIFFKAHISRDGLFALLLYAPDILRRTL